MLRRIGIGLGILLAAITTLALPFATHVTEYAYDETHHTISETSFGPWLISLAIAAALVGAYRGRLIRTVIVTPLVSVGAFFGFLWVALAHLLTRTFSNGAEDVTLICLFLLFWLGPALFILEWFVVVLERNKLEREDPQFPTARVVR